MAKIIAVDNESNIAKFEKEILEREGHDVAEAHSGEECLDKLDEVDPDLILLDIMMPDLSGWDVYNRIRERNDDVKVIFVSVLEVSSEKIEKLKDKGIVDYIEKPLSRSQLVERVKKALEE